MHDGYQLLVLAYPVSSYLYVYSCTPYRFADLLRSDFYAGMVLNKEK